MLSIIQSRTFRCIFCLLLICCLLVNISPIRVKATAAAATAVVGTVAIGFAVAACMQALGVRAGTDASTFTSLVNACANALSPSWAVDGFVTMLAVTTGTVTKTYASQNFLQAILDWLFSNDTVRDTSPTFSTSECTGIFAGSTYRYSMNVPFTVYSVCLFDGTYYYPNLFICATAITDYYYSGSTKFSFSSNPNLVFVDGYYLCYCANWGTHSSPDAYYSNVSDWADLGVISVPSGTSIVDFFSLLSKDDLLGGISTSEDLTLESVGRDVDTDYKTYVDTGIVSVDFGITFEDDPNTDPDESENNDKPWVPTTIPSLNPGYDDQIPDDARTGLTPEDVLDEIISDPSDSGSGSDSGPGTDDSSSGGSGSWAPSSFDGFALDLSKYFPFCIPFDLYDFFTCLNADPVAPVIEWAIPMPGGDTYPLEIDLSPFDPVAQLLRRLELLLFCVGLAFKTRDLIKG